MKATDTTDAVEAFMRTLEHPHKKEVQLNRAPILGADESIEEGVKWNAITWLGQDRAMITFTAMKDVKAKSEAFQKLISEWIHFV